MHLSLLISISLLSTLSPPTHPHPPSPPPATGALHFLKIRSQPYQISPSSSIHGMGLSNSLILGIFDRCCRFIRRHGGRFRRQCRHLCRNNLHMKSCAFSSPMTVMHFHSNLQRLSWDNLKRETHMQSHDDNDDDDDDNEDDDDELMMMN